VVTAKDRAAGSQGKHEPGPDHHDAERRSGGCGDRREPRSSRRQHHRHYRDDARTRRAAVRATKRTRPRPQPHRDLVATGDTQPSDDREGSARHRNQYQPGSPLSHWYAHKTADQSPRIRRIMLIALARKLAISLWRFVETGLVPDGAVMAKTTPHMAATM
jgi:hypothetical protein